MGLNFKIIFISCALFLAGTVAEASVYNVRDFGAAGDGRSIDSEAVNKAISAASANGGGQVYVPSGIYSCYSIRLASHVSLYLEKGAVIKAAQYTDEAGFDAPEQNPWIGYQDFGHSHWKNSLIWGIGLDDISICGEGMIDGTLLSDGFTDKAATTGIDCDFTLKKNVANKAISLKDCRNVNLSGITIFRGGHFALLATGVDNLFIRDIRVDTNRDGLDIDCCRGVLITGCTINSPWDDAIVMKSSYALGRYVDCENISISDCRISGYEIGSILSYEKAQPSKANHDPRTRKGGGRIKFGTETSGGFKNITVTNCCLENCGGIIVESTDGGEVEDLCFSNISMRGCVDSPVYVVLGSRLRSPEGRGIGHIRRVRFDNFSIYDSRADYNVIITGCVTHKVSDISLSNMHFHAKGGVKKSMAAKLADVPEIKKQYPDPKAFPVMPSKGIFVRHADNVSFNNICFEFAEPDERPLIVKSDVANLRIQNVYEKK